MESNGISFSLVMARRKVSYRRYSTLNSNSGRFRLFADVHPEVTSGRKAVNKTPFGHIEPGESDESVVWHMGRQRAKKADKR